MCQIHSVFFYLIEGMPRSLHIFWASISLISECLGMADFLLMFNQLAAFYTAIVSSWNSLPAAERASFLLNLRASLSVILRLFRSSPFVFS